MGRQIIRQPDGLYCVWSTIVDDIVVWDADREEIIEYFAERAAEEARDRALITVDLVDRGDRCAYAQFTIPWERAAPKVEALRERVARGEEV
jgi:DNA/RNA-binding domain of Phe-tRNA-synthetase-like protein